MLGSFDAAMLELLRVSFVAGYVKGLENSNPGGADPYTLANAEFERICSKVDDVFEYFDEAQDRLDVN